MTAPGTLIAGRYRLVRPVGAGGMGSVWEAWDELLQRRVAVKQLLPQPGLSAGEAAVARDRVIREARNTARLHHPNAVTLYDVTGFDGRPCLIMQFVPSVTLSALIGTEGPVQPQFAARIGVELAAALGAAHEVGIIHRDVKPGNVLIADDSSAKLTDFGISHAVGDATLTSTGMITGTPAFLAPEVARGGASGFAADVFSLGATLYAAMEGGPPSGTDVNPMAVLHRVASGHLIPPERTGRLTPLVLQMLAQDPADRPTIGQITDALTRLNQEFAGGDRESPQSVGPAPVTQTLQTFRTTPPADPTAAEVRTALEGLPGVALHQPSTATLLEPAGRRRRIGVVPLAVVAAVLTAAIVVGVLLVSSRAGSDQAGPPAASPSASSGRTTPSGSSTARSSAAPRSSGVVGAPPATAPRPSTARSATTAPSTTTQSTTASSARSSAVTQSSSTARSSTTSSSTPSSSTTSSSTTSSSTASSSTTSSSTTSSSSTSSSTTSSPAGAPSATELARAVTDYYALLPGDTDAAWERLTPRFQSDTAVDRRYYQRFWDSIDRVTIRGAEGSPPDTAGAEITYYFKDGRVAVEATLFTLVRDGDGLDIDTSDVLTSEVR
ncbi:MAG: serine/threonine-protein kinase [Nakamurella sp.]